MGKVVLNEWLTLDGVAQAPALVVVGGKRFRDDALRPLKLVDLRVTTTGAILATYAVAEADRPVMPTVVAGMTGHSTASSTTGTAASPRLYPRVFRSSAD